MSRLGLIILAALLAACATAPAPKYYGDMKPCAVIDGKLICKTNASLEDQRAWVDRHLTPVVDECERASLRRHVWSAIGDSVSTIATLALCAGARELNPVIAVVPGGWLILPLSAGVYWLDYRWKARSSRYQADHFDDSKCAWESTDYAVSARGGVAIWNASVLARCL